MDNLGPGSDAAPPPPPPSPAAAPAGPPGAPPRAVMTTVPTLRRVVRSTATPLLGYAFALGASLLLTAVLVLAIALEADSAASDDPSGDIDIKVIGTLVGIPFQIAAMALGGSIGLGDDDFALRLFAPPLLVTAVFLVAVHRLSRSSELALPSGSTTERAILAAGGGLVTALLAVVATRVLAMRDDDLVMHAATAGLFVGAAALAGVAGFSGRQSAQGSLWPRRTPAEVRRSAHLVTQHVLLWVVLVVPVAVVWMLVDSGVDAALYGLVWGPTLSLGAFAMGHVGAVTALGEHSFAWDLGWFPAVVLPLLAVLFVLLAAVAWHLRRGHDTAWLAHPASWTTLPLAYAAGGLAVCLVSTVRVSGAFFGVDGGVAFHAAYWLVPVLAVWGALVEVASRFLAPALARALPAGLTRRLAAGPKHPLPAPAGPAQRIPMSPGDRARARKGLIAAAVVGGITLLGVVVMSILASTLSDPEKRAEAYLDAVVAGDVAEVLDLAPVDGDEASVALLTDEVYSSAEDRITGYEITDVEEYGSSVTVTVDLEGPEEGDGVELTLTRDGKRAVFFDDWKVDDGGLAREVTVSVPEASSAIEANGVSVEAAGGEDVDFWVLPGSYVFNPYADNPWLEPADEPTAVPAAQTYGLWVETGTPTPSAELREAVDTAVAEWVEGCMAATELDPDDCPQDTYGYGDEQRKVTWTLTTMPTVAWDWFNGTFPFELSSDETGEATVTYEYDASYGFGAPEWTEETDEASLYLSGTVDLVDGEPVVTFAAD
ncbi:hypothetical protein [Nocardioides sp. J54]|uniref:hypothetical protein n=1 Tax=Nocardioides sp. J54 TaxID=935866 RepID=UPI0004ACDCB6|nr:hypothetical protein [Nocardioides sp. J54]